MRFALRDRGQQLGFPDPSASVHHHQLRLVAGVAGFQEVEFVLSADEGHVENRNLSNRNLSNHDFVYRHCVSCGL